MKARIDATAETIVGVNKYKLEAEEEIDVLSIDNEQVKKKQVCSSVCLMALHVWLQSSYMRTISYTSGAASMTSVGVTVGALGCGQKSPRSCEGASLPACACHNNAPSLPCARKHVPICCAVSDCI